jgi:perosamine synthetase
MRVNQVSPWLDSEVDVLHDVISRKWLTEGKYCDLFLENFLAKTNSKYAVLAPNGTLGLFLALLSLDLPRDSEVILPSFTFFGSASSIVFAGLKPVPVDGDLEDYSLTLEALERALTPKTSAVMAVHIYGQAARLDEVRNFCIKNNLRLIEDAAQAMGVMYKGQHAGIIGDVGLISFFADKTITMGEGAVVLTQDQSIYEKLKLLRNQGRPNSGTFIHPALGMNFRVTEMQAAVGYMQLQKLDSIISQRQDTHKKYRTNLTNFQQVKFMKIDEHSTHIPFRAAITVPHKDLTMKMLSEAGYQTRSFFYPMDKQPALSSYIKLGNQCCNALTLYNSGICLPVHRDVADEDISDMSKIIGEANEV